MADRASRVSPSTPRKITRISPSPSSTYGTTKNTNDDIVWPEDIRGKPPLALPRINFPSPRDILVCPLWQPAEWGAGSTCLSKPSFPSLRHRKKTFHPSTPALNDHRPRVLGTARWTKQGDEGKGCCRYLSIRGGNCSRLRRDATSLSDGEIIHKNFRVNFEIERWFW